VCGIVGLFAKHPDVEERLGAHLGAMLIQLANRGPDSAGVAMYRDGRMEIFKEAVDPREFVERFDLAGMSGSHGLGHPRMATESKVTP
jgi:methylamine---glutamate N-methyltransferase subunit A